MTFPSKTGMSNRGREIAFETGDRAGPSAGDVAEAPALLKT